jgi:hypothetical protein
MRRKLFIAIVLPILSVLSTNAHADVKACVHQKFAAMKQVTTGNVGSMFKQHFDQESLVIAANQGELAWRRLTKADQDAAREKLSDNQRLVKLVKTFNEYKSAELTKVTAVSAKAVLIVKTHNGNKTVTIFFGKNCKITRMCTDGICVHQLFR